MTEIIPKLEYVTIKRSEYDYLRAVVGSGGGQLYASLLRDELAAALADHYLDDLEWEDILQAALDENGIALVRGDNG